jgi:hypothetical protein
MLWITQKGSLMGKYIQEPISPKEKDYNPYHG